MFPVTWKIRTGMSWPCQNNLPGTIRFVPRGAQLSCGGGGVTGHTCFPGEVGSGQRVKCWFCLPFNVGRHWPVGFARIVVFRNQAEASFPIKGNVQCSTDTYVSDTGTQNYPRLHATGTTCVLICLTIWTFRECCHQIQICVSNEGVSCLSLRCENPHLTSCIIFPHIGVDSCKEKKTTFWQFFLLYF